MARELLIERPMEEVVMHYAKNAMEAGLDGCRVFAAGIRTGARSLRRASF